MRKSFFRNETLNIKTIVAISAPTAFLLTIVSGFHSFVIIKDINPADDLRKYGREVMKNLKVTTSHYFL